jgi:hypothetical protein
MLWLTEDYLMIHLLFPGLISIVLLTESKARALHVLLMETVCRCCSRPMTAVRPCRTSGLSMEKLKREFSPYSVSVPN